MSERTLTEHSNPVQYKPLLNALVSTLAAAAVGPVILLYIAWLQEPPFDNQTLAGAIGHALTFGVVPLLFSLSVINRALSADSLAERHLQWPPSVCQALLKCSRLMSWFCLPLFWLYTTVESFQGGKWNDSLGRLTFVLAMLILAVGLWNMYQGLQRYCQTCSSSVRQPGLGLETRMFVALASLGPIALITLAVAGYYFTAVQLSWRLYWTVIVMTGIALLAGIVNRTLLIMQSRSNRDPQHHSPGMTSSVHFHTRDTDEVREQVFRLTKMLAVVTIVVLGWHLWSGVIPAISYLDEVHLWQDFSTDGALDPVTLRHVLAAIGIVVIAFVLSRSLPGLVEIVLLDRLPMDRGGRYAVSFVCRYLIMAIGLLSMFCWLGFSWSTVQWLAAGLTVGLGFGLQEIFANLISGLIILIERPIRVGDFVTVNGVSGHVTHMQLRATTIKDLDHRELIVPNKRFISEDVMNWTLSDRCTRVIIQVGIAYGSDTQKANRLLLEIARANPLIKQIPSPEVVFMAFGNGSLNFELRVLIATRDVYFRVVHELNMAIDMTFRQEGIVIALPQRVVHLPGQIKDLAVSTVEPPNSQPGVVDGPRESISSPSAQAA